MFAPRFSLMSLIRWAFSRNPLGLNRRGPLNCRVDQITKNRILLKAGGSVKEAK